MSLNREDIPSIGGNIVQVFKVRQRNHFKEPKIVVQHEEYGLVHRDILSMIIMELMVKRVQLHCKPYNMRLFEISWTIA